MDIDSFFLHPGFGLWMNTKVTTSQVPFQTCLSSTEDRKDRQGRQIDQLQSPAILQLVGYKGRNE